MKITFIVSNDHFLEGWEEDYESHDAGTPGEIIGRLLDNFNSTLRPHELPRRLVKILSVDGAMSGKPALVEHRWEKQNLVTVSDRHGIYDRMKCRVCGAMGRRFELGSNVRVDKIKFNSCPGYDL